MTENTRDDYEREADEFDKEVRRLATSTTSPTSASVAWQPKKLRVRVTMLDRVIQHVNSLRSPRDRTCCEWPDNRMLELCRLRLRLWRQAYEARKSDIPDVDERRRQWRAVANGALRNHLWNPGLWAQRKDILLGPHDAVELPDFDAEVAINALFFTTENQQKARRRQRFRSASVPNHIACRGSSIRRRKSCQHLPLPLIRIRAAAWL